MRLADNQIVPRGRLEPIPPEPGIQPRTIQNDTRPLAPHRGQRVRIENPPLRIKHPERVARTIHLIPVIPTVQIALQRQLPHPRRTVRVRTARETVAARLPLLGQRRADRQLHRLRARRENPKQGSVGLRINAQRQGAAQLVEKLPRLQRHLVARMPLRPTHREAHREIRRRLQVEGKQMTPRALLVDHPVQIPPLVRLRARRVPGHRQPLVPAGHEFEMTPPRQHRLRRPAPRPNPAPLDQARPQSPRHVLRAAPAVEIARHMHRVALRIDIRMPRRIKDELDHSILGKMIPAAQPEVRRGQALQPPHAQGAPRKHEHRHASPPPIMPQLDHAPGGRLKRGGNKGVGAGGHNKAPSFAVPPTAQARRRPCGTGRRPVPLLPNARATCMATNSKNREPRPHLRPHLRDSSWLSSRLFIRLDPTFGNRCSSVKSVFQDSPIRLRTPARPAPPAAPRP